jgi:hypothetical protein
MGEIGGHQGQNISFAAAPHRPLRFPHNGGWKKSLFLAV